MLMPFRPVLFSEKSGLRTAQQQQQLQQQQLQAAYAQQQEQAQAVLRFVVPELGFRISVLGVWGSFECLECRAQGLRLEI